MRAHKRAHAHTRARACTHARTHTRAHTHAHTHAGMALDTDFLVYLNTNGSGFAAIGQDLHDPARPLFLAPQFGSSYL